MLNPSHKPSQAVPARPPCQERESVRRAHREIFAAAQLFWRPVFFPPARVGKWALVVADQLVIGDW